MHHNFTDTATISRKVVTGNKTAYTETGSIACHIQPLTDSYSNGFMGRDGKDFRMFSTGEVRIGDRIVDQNARAYEVTGVSLMNFRARSFYQTTLRGT